MGSSTGFASCFKSDAPAFGRGGADYSTAPELNPAIMDLLKKNERVGKALRKGFDAPFHGVGERLEVFNS